MTNPNPAPTLPQPQPPAVAAQVLAEAAHAASGAWAQPLDSRGHGRAVSQLCSALLDTGIAARRLAAWCPDNSRPGQSGEFARHVTSAASWLLVAWHALENIPPAKGSGRPPEPGEPGTALCRAARSTFPAWRAPSGTAADREATVRRLLTATGFLAAGALGLSAYADGSRAPDLQAVCAALAEVAAALAAAAAEASGEDSAGAAEPRS